MHLVKTHTKKKHLEYYNYNLNIYQFAPYVIFELCKLFM